MNLPPCSPSKGPTIQASCAAPQGARKWRKAPIPEEVMDKIRGLVLPLPTVFESDGRVDEPVMREMVDFYIGAGVHALFVGGSMGQCAALTQDERKRLFDLA